MFLKVRSSSSSPQPLLRVMKLVDGEGEFSGDAVVSVSTKLSVEIPDKAVLEFPIKLENS